MKKAGMIIVLVCFSMFLSTGIVSAGWFGFGDSDITGNVVSDLVCDSEVVAYYNGAGFEDLSGNGYNGVVNGKVSIVDGKVGEAFSFPGINTAYVVLPNEVLNDRDKFSVSFWLKSSGKGDGIFSVARNGGNNEFLISSQQSLRAHVRGVAKLSRADINDGEWHLVVVSLDSSEGSVKFYVDGEFVVEKVTSKKTIIAQGIVLGQDQDRVLGGFDRFQAYDGLLDELIIFDSVLSASEVTDLYNGQSVCAGVEPEPTPEPWPVEEVSLDSLVVVEENVLRVEYSKNFETCVHLLNEDRENVNIEGHNNFCESEDASVKVPLSDYDLTTGESYKLCNNYGICSELVVLKEDYVKELVIDNIAPSGEHMSQDVPTRITLSLDTSEIATCSYSHGNSTDMIEFFDTVSTEHSQEMNLMPGEYDFLVECVSSDGKTSYDNINFEIIFDDAANGTICTDSDGGLDYFVKGTVYSEKTFGGMEIVHLDNCIDSVVLDEGFCNSSREGVDSLLYNCSNGCYNGACAEDPKSCKELVVIPENLSIKGNTWELRYNDTYEYGDYKNYYRHFVSDSTWDYSSVSLNIEEIGGSERDSVEERLDDSISRGLCEQRSVYMDDDGGEKLVYICKDVWRLAYDSQSISENNNNNDVDVLWISGNRMFVVHGYSYNYGGDYCYSYEDCKERDEREHRRQQSEIADVLEKLINNKEEYVGGFYMDWNVENFVRYFLEGCGSDIEEQEGYVGSWACKTEPAICPPHGEQTELCTRWNGDLEKEESREATIQCSPGICSGCYVPRWFEYKGNNKCIPYGVRFEQQTGWKIEEVLVEDNDKESLTVAEAEKAGEDVGLEVYSDGTAVLILEVRDGNYVNISLSVGEKYDWAELTGESHGDMESTLYVDDIFYDSSNYEDSYIKVTFSTAGSQTRNIADTFNAYCNYDGRIMEQKGVDRSGNWANCQNNYECESNLCSSGECVEITSMIESVSGMKSLGVKVLCKLADLFGIDNYEQCIFDSLG